jgi:hypothetical protein
MAIMTNIPAILNITLANPKRMALSQTAKPLGG